MTAAKAYSIENLKLCRSLLPLGGIISADLESAYGLSVKCSNKEIEFDLRSSALKIWVFEIWVKNLWDTLNRTLKQEMNSN